MRGKISWCIIKDSRQATSSSYFFFSSQLHHNVDIYFLSRETNLQSTKKGGNPSAKKIQIQKNSKLLDFSFFLLGLFMIFLFIHFWRLPQVNPLNPTFFFSLLIVLWPHQVRTFFLPLGIVVMTEIFFFFVSQSIAWKILKKVSGIN